ncbi:MAG: hypothetical protein KC912_18065 [Proteobacteria bacterium]|nr:hypothetical protein [Pseudomonadota bacterium]
MWSRLSLLVVGSVLLQPACVRDLPESSLGEDARLLFRDFDADPDALVEVLDHMDETLAGLDLEASKKKRMSGVPELSAAYFEDVTVPEGIDTSDQMRAAMVGLSQHSLDDNLRAQTEEDFTCVNSNAVTCHERLAVDDSDADCFVEGDCDVYRTSNVLRIESVLDFWLKVPVDFRRVTLTDGRAAVVGRTWAEESFDNDNGKRSWEQRFGVDVFIEDPDDSSKTRRYYASWIGPNVTGIPGQFLQPAIRGGLEDGFTNPDAWLDDRTCEVVLSECLADSPF